MKNKTASLLHEILIHIILIALIFALFYAATLDKASSRAVKQQVLEKQIALIIDSASPGMEFTIQKNNMKGTVSNMEIKEGRVFAYVDGQSLSKGYPYFSKNYVSLEKKEGEYLIKIR